MSYIYGIDLRFVILSLTVGVFLAAMLYEKKGILSGGIIVPAIIALFLNKPIFVLTTIIFIAITHFLITQLRKKTILYGRRLYSAILFVGISIALLTKIAMGISHNFGYGMYLGEKSALIKLPLLEFNVPSIIVELGLGQHYYGYVIGLLMIPIVVNDTQNQGLSKTLVALIGIAVLTFLITKTITSFD